MNEPAAARRRPPWPGRSVALAAAAVGLALLGAACGGSPRTSGAAGPASGSQPSIAEAMNAFSACLGRHGLPGTYVANAGQGTPPPPESVVGGAIFHGYYVTGANPSDPHYAPADQACKHLVPHGTPPTAAELRQQFYSALKAARCMRAHGFPDWPDPVEVNGAVGNAVPTGADTDSPRFQATAKECGAAA